MTGSSVDSYLLCATARSGSTLLCGLLESSGVAGHPASYFIRRGLDEYAAAWGIARREDGRIDGPYLRAAHAAGRTPNGIFAARLMGETRPELFGDLRAGAPGPGMSDVDLLAAEFGRLEFVHLRRLDVVAQAVSWARSLQTHYWHPGETVVPGGMEPHYDEALIAELVGRIGTLEAEWTTWFADHAVTPYELTYEELAAAPVATAQRVLDHLGLAMPPDRRLETGHRRQADHLNADWIARFQSRTST